MTSDLLNALFAEDNVQSALLHMMEKKNTVDSTGLELYRLPEYWQANCRFFREMIENECYLCETVTMFHVPKKNGGTRTLANIPHMDMLLERMLYQVVQPIISAELQGSCFAFMPNRSIAQLVDQVLVWAEEGKAFCACIDIAHFFDDIPLDAILEKTRLLIKDSAVMALLNSFLFACRSYDHQNPLRPQQGLLQGSPLSPLLSNLYLNAFDKLQTGQWYLRYSDDLFCFFENEEEAQAWFQQAQHVLKRQFSLSIQMEKSAVYPIDGLPVLGYRIRKYYNHWKADVLYAKEPFYSTQWQMQSLKSMDRSLWLLKDGGLSLRDGALLFETDDKEKKQFPAETIDTIHVMSRTTLSSTLFEYANLKRIRLCFYDRHGTYVGDFIPQCGNAIADVLLRQASICNDEEKRLHYAAGILTAALHNMIFTLRQYNGQSRAIAPAITRIREQEKQMEQVDSINTLMLLEANARKTYYEMFNAVILQQEFAFIKRTRRPPEDALNALLSFGNVVLYNRIATDIHRMGLEISLSFLHAPEEGRQSLALDLAEIFKPLIVDRTIFGLVNRKELSVKHHFDKAGARAVYLNQEGKRVFLAALNRHLNTWITINGKKYTWERIICNEVYRLKRSMLTDEPYQPYRHR